MGMMKPIHCPIPDGIPIPISLKLGSRIGISNAGWEVVVLCRTAVKVERDKCTSDSQIETIIRNSNLSKDT